MDKNYKKKFSYNSLFEDKKRKEKNANERKRKEWVEDNHLTGNNVYCHSGGYPHLSTKDESKRQFQLAVT